ncbi:MAG TPA: PCRF domain-containing protein, partial [Candidatus Acidoferrales bacterium]|nr:PCRF domain-containing protein [Candidatus Acidoferrales bacterium]
MQFVQKLDQLEKRFDELTNQMADPAVIGDAEQYRKVTKAHSDLSEITGKYREWKKVDDGLSQARQMLEEQDPDLRAMAEQEVAQLEPERARIENELKILLLP